MDGFVIDGVEDSGFVDDFCKWEMVTGATGTYLRSIEIHHDFYDWKHLVDYPLDEFLEHWYFDSDDVQCDDCGDGGSSVVGANETSINLCTSLLNDQVTLNICFTNLF